MEVVNFKRKKQLLGYIEAFLRFFQIKQYSRYFGNARLLFFGRSAVPARPAELAKSRSAMSRSSGVRQMVDENAPFALLGLCPRFGEPRCARPVIDSLPTALLITDRLGTVRLANKRAGDLLGRRVRDLPGTPIETLLAPLDVLRRRLDERGSELAVELADHRLIIGYGLSAVGGLFWDEQDEQYCVTFEDISRIAEVEEVFLDACRTLTVEN